NRKVLEALIKSGACDSFGETRATLYAKIDRVLQRAAGIIADRQRGQNTLFGMFEEPAAEERKAEPDKQLPEWPQNELLANEKELLGFYVSGHPLTPFAPLIEKYGVHNTSQLSALPGRSMTRIAGLISVVQQGMSKKSGKPYAMVTLEDLMGTVQVLCMNENYDKFRHLFVPNKAVLVIGEVNNAEDKAKIFPQEIMLLEDAPKKFTKQVHLRLNTEGLNTDSFRRLLSYAEGSPGKVPLFLCLKRPGGEMIYIEAHEKYSITPSYQLQQSIDSEFGSNTYYAKVDTSLPEPQRRRWESKSNGNGGGDD
ncbi:MAG: OB-fold nucleic acid binding domain-containing protein, partial [Limisphaerales bacterium]